MHEKLSLNLYKRANYAELLIATVKYVRHIKSGTHDFNIQKCRLIIVIFNSFEQEAMCDD